MLTFRADFRDTILARLQQAEEALRAQALPAQARLGPGGLLEPRPDWVVGQVWAIRSQLLLAAILMGMGPYQVDAEYIIYLAWLHIEIALGRPDRALAFIAPVYQSAQEHGLIHRLIELAIVQGLALAASGDWDQAVGKLRAILPLAEPERYIRIFDRGTALDELLVKVAQKGDQRSYIELLFDSLDGRPTTGRKVRLAGWRQCFP